MESSFIMDGVLEASTAILESTTQAYTDFLRFVTNLEQEYPKFTVQKKQQDEAQKQIDEVIKREEEAQAAIIRSIYACKSDLELFESNVSVRRELEAVKQSEHLNSERIIANLKEHMNALLKQRETLKARRNEILACKQISNIDFVYSIKKVTGIIKKDQPASFNLDPKNITQKQITETLWDLALAE